MDRQAPAEAPLDAEGRQYHLGVGPGELAPSILLVGEPKRAERVAARFSEIELERRNREYVTFTGRYEGLRVSVIGTGMSTANVEIAMVELWSVLDDDARARACVIRCGSTGALQPGIELGDLVVSQGALRLESTSLAYVDPGYPALAHPEVVLALAQCADRQGHRFHLGINATASGFYGAQGRSVGGFVPREPKLIEQLVAQGITNLEMEGSTVLTLASLRGIRAGMVCAVYATRHAGSFVDAAHKQAAESACIDTGLGALVELEGMRRERGSRPLWHPGLRSPKR